MKKDLFFYFILKLKEKYDTNNPSIQIDRYYVLKMLFIASVNDNNIRNWLWDYSFNNFYAMENWPVESNCYNYIYEKWGNFEKIINSIDNINKEIGDITYEYKTIIDNAVNRISDFLFYKDSDYLIDYTHTFNSWKIAWEKCKIYQKRAYPIDIKDIENDWE